MTETDSAAMVARALRALEISGRRLFRLRDGRWGVMRDSDRRRRPLVTLSAETVERLAAAGKVRPGDAETFVRDAATGQDWALSPPRALFVAACLRRPGRRSGGIGFAGLAMLARDGRGPLSLRHVQAGLRLAADAESAAADPRVTMNWDAGPVTRTRRGGADGGRRGAARLAARRIARVRVLVGEDNWRLAWMLCVDAEPLDVVRRRFAIAQRGLHARVAEAMEALAAGYG